MHEVKQKILVLFVTLLLESLNAAMPLSAEPAAAAPWTVSDELGLLPELPDLDSSFPAQPPRTYSGPNLEHVIVPIGGIGTGCVFLDQDGRLSGWHVFNNFNAPRLEHTFMAIRAQVEGMQPQTRVLQTVPEKGFQAMKSMKLEGSYPVVRLLFEDDDFPLSVAMEAFNPMIPLDAVNSSLPCAIFRVAVSNRTDKPAEVALLQTCLNAVGSEGGASGVVAQNCYGGNRNVLRKNDSAVMAVMSRAVEAPEFGQVKIRKKSGREVDGPALFLAPELASPIEMLRTAQQAAASRSQWDPQQEMLWRLFLNNPLKFIVSLPRSGGAILFSETRCGFWESVLKARHGRDDWLAVELFDDFEDEEFDMKWIMEGPEDGSATAFEKGPARIKDGQRAAGIGSGARLADSRCPDEKSMGSMTSEPFEVKYPYIGFLIAGGKYPNATAVSLLIDDRPVRSATGRNSDRLEPVVWDVSEFIGRSGRFQILDMHMGEWGYVAVDRIVFAEAPPFQAAELAAPFAEFAAALPVEFEAAAEETPKKAGSVRLTETGKKVFGDGVPPCSWNFDSFVSLKGFRAGAGAETAAETEDGNPLVILCDVGKARFIFSLAPGLPRKWAEPLLAWARGGLAADEEFAPVSFGHGTMCIAMDMPAGGAAMWDINAGLAEEFLASGAIAGPEDSGLSPAGATWPAALCGSFSLRPAESRTGTLLYVWHFPNAWRFGHAGNVYGRRFRDAEAVAEYVLSNLARLTGWTARYQRTLYESNLPPLLLDAFASQSVIFRSPTCFWAEDGYFGGWEGSEGCCPLNCTHVWNYSQTHALLFPELGRNMRESDLLKYLHPTGETSHRQHSVLTAFVDGHCAAISAAYREHLMSKDISFLERVWPAVKKATDWLIGRYDADEDGVLSGPQDNTYDCATSGAHTFIGSQYLCALGAAERMALLMDDEASAERYRKVRESGSEKQSEMLWNGEYFMQIPDTAGCAEYNTGCHADQLLGQWWAHLLGLGRLYPADRIAGALGSIMRHNYFEQVRGHYSGRRFAADDDGGIILCTWPKGGKPPQPIVYWGEAWTGVEYAVAGLMLWEGMIDEAVRVVDTVRRRYDGRSRRFQGWPDPGGDPFNEIECGSYYARALSSGALLPAAQGLMVDGPAGMLGFDPRWQPQKHRSFFVSPWGWGLFSQSRSDNSQSVLVSMRYGTLKLREFRLAVPDAACQAKASQFQVDGATVEHALKQDGRVVRFIFQNTVECKADLTVELAW